MLRFTIRGGARAVLWSSLALMPACDPSAEANATLAEEILTWEEFRDAAKRVADGRTMYVVDGDIPVSLDELEVEYDRYVDVKTGNVPRSLVRTFGPSGAIDRWSGGQEHHLTYCVSTDFGSDHARGIEEMLEATRDWEQVANVDFEYLGAHDGNCHAGNSNVKFVVRPWNADGAKAFFPSYPPAERVLYMNYDAFGPGSAAPSSVGILRHELGHVLGLAHEHFRVTDPSCWSNDDWDPLTIYDRQSVMHYPWCASGTGVSNLGLTLADQRGARALYGPPAVSTHRDLVPVDFDGDGRSDVGLTGPGGWASVPVAFGKGGNGFSVTNKGNSWLAASAATDGVLAATGDINGDGDTDIFLTGPSHWGTVRVGLSNGDGSFYNVEPSGFPIFLWAQTAARDGVKLLTGHFNEDSLQDFAIIGGKVAGAPWHTMPVLLSQGNNFQLKDAPIQHVGTWATLPNVRIITGHFNHDEFTDVALTGPNGWGSLPIAFSDGDGTFSVSNYALAQFPTWAAHPDAVVLPGDYNGDGLTDLALAGPAAWNSIPIAFSNGNGTFSVTNVSNPTVAGWAELLGVQMLPGDYNWDNCTDIALTGPLTDLTGTVNWNTLPVAFSNCDGGFTVTNYAISNFADWSETGAMTAVGDFNGDGLSDLALTGPEIWNSIPVAFSNGGNGTFAVGNYGVTNFDDWASRESIIALH